MKIDDLELKICRFLEENAIDDESFSVIALNVARFALNNPRRVQIMKDWAKTIIKLSNGNEERESVLSSNLFDEILKAGVFESAFVYLSDGKHHGILQHGDDDTIVVNITEVVNSDDTGILFNTLSALMSNMLFDNPQLFADFKVEMSNIEKDLIESGDPIPSPSGREYEPYDLDLIVSV